MRREEWIARLGQLQSLKKEVDELSQRIAKLELAAQGRISCRQGTRKLEGRIAELSERLDARRLACMEELGRLYAFIDEIPDSITRRVFTARYIDGLTWQATAFRIDEHDEQYPRRLHNQYLEKLKDDENDEKSDL